MEPESVAEDIPGTDNIYSQLFDNPRDTYPDRDAAGLADIQAQDPLQYHCPGPYNVDAAGLLAVQVHPVYYRQFPRLCPRDNGGHAADFESGTAVWADSGNSVARAVRQSHAGYREIELFKRLADTIACRQTYIAAEAGTGRAGRAETVYLLPPAHAVSAQIDNTVSAADSPIQGETSCTGLYC